MCRWRVQLPALPFVVERSIVVEGPQRFLELSRVTPRPWRASTETEINLLVAIIKNTRRIIYGNFNC